MRVISWKKNRCFSWILSENEKLNVKNLFLKLNSQKVIIIFWDRRYANSTYLLWFAYAKVKIPYTITRIVHFVPPEECCHFIKNTCGRLITHVNICLTCMQKFCNFRFSPFISTDMIQNHQKAMIVIIIHESWIQ